MFVFSLSLCIFLRILKFIFKTEADLVLLIFGIFFLECLLVFGEQKGRAALRLKFLARIYSFRKITI